MSLGDRMKKYEDKWKTFLPKEEPVIIRIDGKAFHSFTKGFDKPFDTIFFTAMRMTTKALCENIQNCVLGYTQSDEISLLLVSYKNERTDTWFGNAVQKICSVSASMATMEFNRIFNEKVNDMYNFYLGATEQGHNIIRSVEEFDKKYDNYFDKSFTAMFDSRVFSLPIDEVNNYFINRQQDAIRNSVQAVGQANFPHKELHGKNTEQVVEMLKEKGIFWDGLPKPLQRGMCVRKMNKEIPLPDGSVVNRMKFAMDTNTPLFVEDRKYVERLV